MTTVVLEQSRRETPSVRTLRLRWEQRGFDFKPGHAVRLSFPDEPATERSYSIASSPLERDFIEISVGNVGRFSARLFELQEGARLLADGPSGRWAYADDVDDAVLISGGTGLTPFRSVLRYVLQKKLAHRLRLLHSARQPEELLYRDELDAWSRHSNFRVKVTFTRAQTSPAPWAASGGRIDLEAVKKDVPDLRKPHFFLCGPQQLVTSLANALSAAGVPAERLHYESWG